MVRNSILIVLLAAVTFTPLRADDSALPTADQARRAVVDELHRYERDAKSLATAPARWKTEQWARFAAGAAGVVALYAADRRLSEDVQRNRGAFSNNFAKVVTPFGGQRALDGALVMIAAGIWTRDDTMCDAGRDALESELWAAGLVTPILKRAFGRARPVQNEGARSFHPFSSKDASFPSGHSTNAFAFATAVAGHYEGWVVPTIVYSIASGVAISRVNDRAHFPSDVLAGALIGHTVARGIVHRHQNSKTAIIVTPSWVAHRPGLSVHFTLP
jgi:membrane-associated phospholipid phosphatase